jgi:hypothetical protein
MTERHTSITVSIDDVRTIERFIAAYHGDDLFRAINLHFPTASYRAVLLALERARAARWLELEGTA